jgi:hypothetical protein
LFSLRRKKRCARYGEGEDDDDCELVDKKPHLNDPGDGTSGESASGDQSTGPTNGGVLQEASETHTDSSSNSQGLVPIAT